MYGTIMYASSVYASSAGLTDDLPFKIEKDFLLGKYRASRHSYFQVISKEFSTSPPHYLLKPAAVAFEHMADVAKKDGIHLKILSAFRTFSRQKQIWESKYNGNTLVEGMNLMRAYPKNFNSRVSKILLYSAAPGSSRHHWGTDFDLNSVSPEYFEKGEGLKVFQWLEQHASTYGFFRPYGAGRTSGYQEEKWHWSYFPLSDILLNEYRKSITLKDLDGFMGSQNLPNHFIQDYVLGINSYADNRY